MHRPPSSPPSTPRSTRHLLCLLLACVALLAGGFGFAASSSHAQPPPRRDDGPSSLTDAERRGKILYLSGESATGAEVTAMLGAGGTEVPASTLPCSSCHGFDGKGRAEGGMNPSNITWRSLTRPYGNTHPSGREHPPYDERALVKAIAFGVDPAGNPLDPLMPRYQLSHQDAADLVAYLRRIAEDRDPGVEEDRLVIGSLLPGATELGDAVRATLEAAVTEVNEQGGVWGRRLELVAIPTLTEPSVRADQARYFFDDKRPFALVAPYLVGAESELLDALAERSLPAVGALALEPQVGFPLDRRIFYLYQGRGGQARLLVKELVGRLEDGAPWAVVHPPGPGWEALAAEVERDALGLGLERPGRLEDPPGAYDEELLARSLREGGYRAVLYLGPGPEGVDLARAAAAGAAAPPLFLAPGYGAGPEMLAALAAGQQGASGRRERSLTPPLLVALPTLPSDPRPQAVQHLASLLGEKRDDNPAHATVQLSVYGAFRLLLEGLQRAGRDLSREGLIQALEGLYRFDTGVTQPLSYGPNRRIGLHGVYLIELRGEDGGFAGPPRWVELP